MWKGLRYGISKAFSTDDSKSRKGRPRRPRSASGSKYTSTYLKRVFHSLRGSPDALPTWQSALTALRSNPHTKTSPQLLLHFFQWCMDRLAQMTPEQAIKADTSKLSRTIRNVLLVLLQRPEFNLPLSLQPSNWASVLGERPETNDPTDTKSSGRWRLKSKKQVWTQDKPETRWKTLAKYQCLLCRLLKYINVSLPKWKNQQSERQNYEIEFAANVMAIAFFRMPSFQFEMILRLQDLQTKRRWRWPRKGRAFRRLMGLAPVIVSTCTEYGKSILVENSFESRKRKPNRNQKGLFEETNPSFFLWHLLENMNSVVDSRIESTDTVITADTSTSSVTLDKAETDPVSLPRLCMQTDIGHLLEFLEENALFYTMFVKGYCQNVRQVAIGQILWETLPGYALISNLEGSILLESSWRSWNDLQWIEGDDGVVRATPREHILDTTSELRDEDFVHCKKPSILELPFTDLKQTVRMCSSMLVNPNMLSHFTKILLHSTNLNSIYSVSLCLAQLHSWFSITHSNCEKVLKASTSEESEAESNEFRRLPDNIQTESLYSGIERLLISEHFEILQKTLVFVYHVLNIGNAEMQDRIWELLKLNFFRLFLHWNQEVRSLTHYIVVYHTFNYNRLILIGLEDALVNTDRLLAPEWTRHHVLLDKGKKRIRQRKDTVLKRYISRWKEIDNMVLSILYRFKESVLQSVQVSEDIMELGSRIPAGSEPYVNVALATYSDILVTYFKYARKATKLFDVIEPPEIASKSSNLSQD